MGLLLVLHALQGHTTSLAAVEPLAVIALPVPILVAMGRLIAWRVWPAQWLVQLAPQSVQLAKRGPMMLQGAPAPHAPPVLSVSTLLTATQFPAPTVPLAMSPPPPGKASAQIVFLAPLMLLVEAALTALNVPPGR